MIAPITSLNPQALFETTPDTIVPTTMPAMVSMTWVTIFFVRSFMFETLAPSAIRPAQSDKRAAGKVECMHLL